MDDVAVIEASEDMENCVGFTDICKELVTKTFALARTFYETSAKCCDAL